MSATAPAISPSPITSRLQSIDIFRGAIMIVMALDHVRDYFHTGARLFSPEDLTMTTAAIFFTRWITHFCAPLFMFLAGTSAFLWQQRPGRTRADLSRFLLARGAWLMFLEVTVCRSLGWLFNFDYHFTLLIVIWALGLSMILLAVQIFLPYRVLLTVSLLVIGLHNFLDPISAKRFGGFAWVWNIIHQPGAFALDKTHLIISTYPIVPWFSVMAAGYCFGRVFLMDSARRSRLLLRLGAGLTAGFIVLRAINIYGDASHWATQKSAIFNVMSFLNCSKYPPSLDYLLMTIGPAILVIGLMENVRLSAANPLLVFGRVPFFYYMLHIPLIHAFAILLARLRYGHAEFLTDSLGIFGSNAFPPGYGYHLWICYLIWIGAVAVLYFPCRWYAGFRQRRSDWWLSYL